MTEIGLDPYRFSISWSRLISDPRMPTVWTNGRVAADVLLEEHEDPLRLFMDFSLGVSAWNLQLPNPNSKFFVVENAIAAAYSFVQVVRCVVSMVMCCSTSPWPGSSSLEIRF